MAPSPNAISKPTSAVVCVDPVAIGVRPPTGRNPIGRPHPAVTIEREPLTVRRKLVVKDAYIDDDALRRCGGSCPRSRAYATAGGPERDHKLKRDE